MTTLIELETAYDYHEAEERKHLLEKCKIIARIRKEKSWLQGEYTSFEDYMSKKRGKERSEGHEMALIGERLESAITDSDLRMHHLKTLAHIPATIRLATVQMLDILDKPTANAINNLAEYIGSLVASGHVEPIEGEMVSLKTATLIEVGWTLESLERNKRAIQHQMEKNPPFFSENGITLRQAFNFSTLQAHGYSPDDPVSIELRKTKSGLTVNIRLAEKVRA